MWQIVLRTIKDRKTSLIVYTLSGILLLEMYIAMFPSIRDKAAQFNDLMKYYPESLMKAFGITDLNFTSLQNFLTMEQFSMIWPILVIFLMVSLAGPGLAGEIERCTMEIILSRPVSRLKIYWGRYIAGIIALLVFGLTSIYAVVPFAELHKVDYALKNYGSLAIVGLLFGLAVFSMAMFFSALFSERGKVYMASGGILVFMYVLRLVASLKENLDKLKYFSFFHYYNPNDALIRNIINYNAIWVFSGVIIICTILGAIIFIKRDIRN